MRVMPDFPSEPTSLQQDLELVLHLRHPHVQTLGGQEVNGEMYNDLQIIS